MSVVLRFMQTLTQGAPPPARAVANGTAKVLGILDPQEFVPLDRGDFEALLPEEVDKLEVYCFANCSTTMEYVTKNKHGCHVPHIESFGNTKDIVARLAVSAPNPKRWSVKIDGPRYEREAWGHLLNEHYLSAIDQEQRQGRQRGPRDDATAKPFELINPDDFPGAVPRIYRYLNGGSPPLDDPGAGGPQVPRQPGRERERSRPVNAPSGAKELSP